MENMTKDERSGLGKTLILLVFGVVSVISFGFDVVAISLFVAAVAAFVGFYLPARKMRLDA